MCGCMCMLRATTRIAWVCICTAMASLDRKHRNVHKHIRTRIESELIVSTSCFMNTHSNTRLEGDWTIVLRSPFTIHTARERAGMDFICGSTSSVWLFICQFYWWKIIDRILAATSSSNSVVALAEQNERRSQTLVVCCCSPMYVCVCEYRCMAALFHIFHYACVCLCTSERIHSHRQRQQHICNEHNENMNINVAKKAHRIEQSRYFRWKSNFNLQISF